MAYDFFRFLRRPLQGLVALLAVGVGIWLTIRTFDAWGQGRSFRGPQRQTRPSLPLVDPQVSIDRDGLAAMVTLPPGPAIRLEEPGARRALNVLPNDRLRITPLPNSVVEIGGQRAKPEGAGGYDGRLEGGLDQNLTLSPIYYSTVDHPNYYEKSVHAEGVPWFRVGDSERCGTEVLCSGAFYFRVEIIERDGKIL